MTCGGRRGARDARSKNVPWSPCSMRCGFDAARATYFERVEISILLFEGGVVPRVVVPNLVQPQHTVHHLLNPRIRTSVDLGFEFGWSVHHQVHGVGHERLSS